MLSIDSRNIFFFSLCLLLLLLLLFLLLCCSPSKREESVQKFWKRTTKRPIREDGTHDALFASKSPRETKTKASLAWKARICDASSPFPTVAFGVARARARLRKSKKTTKADLVVAKAKETHFKPHFSKAHLFHILVAVVTLHVRLFFALRVRVVIVVRERDVVVRTGLVSSFFFFSSSSFRTHFIIIIFCALSA